MALKFPDGAVVGFATSLAKSIPFTAATKANPMVISHNEALSKGDAVAIVQSTWTVINNRAAVVAVTEGESGKASLLGIDTSDPQMFTGAGAGSLVVASGFIDFSQQGELSSSGGEPQTYTGKHLENPMGQEFEVPIGQTARRYALTLDYDPSLDWFEPAKAITRKRQPTIIRVKLPDGDTIYEYGYVHFNPGLNMQSGQPIKNAVTFFLTSSEGTLISVEEP